MRFAILFLSVLLTGCTCVAILGGTCSSTQHCCDCPTEKTTTIEEQLKPTVAPRRCTPIPGNIYGASTCEL